MVTINISFGQFLPKDELEKAVGFKGHTLDQLLVGSGARIRYDGIRPLYEFNQQVFDTANRLREEETQLEAKLSEIEAKVGSLSGVLTIKKEKKRLYLAVTKECNDSEEFKTALQPYDSLLKQRIEVNDPLVLEQYGLKINLAPDQSAYLYLFGNSPLARRQKPDSALATLTETKDDIIEDTQIPEPVRSDLGTEGSTLSEIVDRQKPEVHPEIVQDHQEISDLTKKLLEIKSCLDEIKHYGLIGYNLYAGVLRVAIRQRSIVNSKEYLGLLYDYKDVPREIKKVFQLSELYGIEHSLDLLPDDVYLVTFGIGSAGDELERILGIKETKETEDPVIGGDFLVKDIPKIVPKRKRAIAVPINMTFHDFYAKYKDGMSASDLREFKKAKSRFDSYNRPGRTPNDLMIMADAIIEMRDIRDKYLAFGE